MSTLRLVVSHVTSQNTRKTAQNSGNSTHTVKNRGAPHNKNAEGAKPSDRLAVLLENADIENDQQQRQHDSEQQPNRKVKRAEQTARGILETLVLLVRSGWCRSAFHIRSRNRPIEKVQNVTVKGYRFHARGFDCAVWLQQTVGHSEEQ